MAKIIYSVQRIEKKAGVLTGEALRALFSEAARINCTLVQAGKKTAYFFIDPLLNPFEAANYFYFKIMGCETVNKLNCYRSGAGPIQALADAKELIENGLYDAVFICGCEPLLTNKSQYGKALIRQSMDIFGGPSILSCYHNLARLYSEQLEIGMDTFEELAEALFHNYVRTFVRTHPGESVPARGAKMDAAGASFFRLTDCANPNLDFAGGIIAASCETASWLSLPNPVEILAADYALVESDPANLKPIVGSCEQTFPHLRQVLSAVQEVSGLNAVQAVEAGKLLLDVYTCYPPIPLAFLLTGGFIKSPAALFDFLNRREITLDGGLNLAGAPWNNPVLSSLVLGHTELYASQADYLLIHGNGGIGEVQGAAILAKA